MVGKGIGIVNATNEYIAANNDDGWYGKAWSKVMIIRKSWFINDV